VPNLPAVVVVQATGAHTCAATSGGESYCWGYNVEGQLGDGTRNHRSRPVRVAGPSR
jgi:alpha-tubulin suppressor-like RCC1 family protein